MKHKSISVIMVFTLISGCGPLIPIPDDAPKRYTLSHLEEKHQSPRIPKQLLVEIPNASVTLDSSRIAVIPAPQQLDYFADMEWSDRLPILIQESLTYSLQNQHLFQGVTRSTDGIIPDQSLKIDIRKFYVNRTHAPQAQLEYFVQLIDIASRNELASKTFTATASLPNDFTSDTIAVTLDQINLKFTDDLQIWLSHRSLG